MGDQGQILVCPPKFIEGSPCTRVYLCTHVKNISQGQMPECQGPSPSLRSILGKRRACISCFIHFVAPLTVSKTPSYKL